MYHADRGCLAPWNANPSQAGWFSGRPQPVTGLGFHTANSGYQIAGAFQPPRRSRSFARAPMRHLHASDARLSAPLREVLVCRVALLDVFGRLDRTDVEFEIGQVSARVMNEVRGELPRASQAGCAVPD